MINLMKQTFIIVNLRNQNSSGGFRLRGDTHTTSNLRGWRGHDEPNINILLTRNLPFGSDVRQ